MSDQPHRLGEHGYFRAVVVDFDGTMTTTGQLSSQMIEALAQVRASGIRVVLATGRIVDELVVSEPTVADHFDLIVAENGAVLWRGDDQHPLVAPVLPELTERLQRRGVEVRSGRVLVAGHAADEVAVLEELRQMGEEYQLVRNRGELMVLPPGVTKGSGARVALGELGLSSHSALAVGDAENDHSLFDACEAGAAVADAVASLRHHADLVLDLPNGDGVAALLGGPLLEGRRRLLPRRWRINLGRADATGAVSLPASQINILVAGGTGTGKSYTAGLLVEQLVHLRYTVLVVDPEGDHRGLGGLAGVTVTGREDALLPPDVVVRLLSPQGGAVVVDLSTTPPIQQAQYLRALWAEVEAHRSVTGLPHWVVTDEAQRALRVLSAGQASFDTATKGHMFVTWRAADLPAEAIAGLDVVVAVGESGESASVELAAAVAGVSRSRVAREIDEHSSSIIVARRWHPGELVRCALPDRTTAHRRHDHKYEREGVPEGERFWLWRPPGSDEGERCVAGLAELEVELARCHPSVLAHHGAHGDFSRWIAEVIKDLALARRVAAIEATLAEPNPSDVMIESARVGLLALMQSRGIAR